MAPGIRPHVLLASGVALLAMVLAAPPPMAQELAPGDRASVAEPAARMPPMKADAQLRTGCGTISAALDCGDAISGTTVGAVNVMSSYICIPSWNESGPEDVFSLTIQAGGLWSVTATISGMSQDLDIFVLGPSLCDSDVCVAYGDSAATVNNADGGATYYVVVDGFSGAASEYDLDVSCTPTHGLLQGTVIDTVSQAPPCTATNVHIDPIGLDLGIDPQTGAYGPVALAPGWYDLTVTALNYPTSPMNTTNYISAGQTTVQNFSLARASAGVTPGNFVGVTGVVGAAFTETLTIINDGHWVMDWELWESPYDLPWLAVGQTSGTLPELDSVDVDIYFDCPEEGDFTGELLLLSSDPCNPAIYIPILLSCSTGSANIFEDGFESGDTLAWSWTVP